MSSNTMWMGLRPSARQLSSSMSRSFSTTPAILSNNHIPPESPSYIRLPSPPQSQEDEVKLPRVRGTLPVPREVFPRAEGDRKIQASYMAKTAPKPTKVRDSPSASQKWKSEMADARRSNLEQSLQALWKRREKSDEMRHQRVRKNFRKNNQAALAPEREDERLTRSTVLDAVLDTRVYPDPNALTRLAKSKEKVAAKETAKYEARRDALMELYINASSFIVHESELKEEIDRIFAEGYFRKESQVEEHVGATENVWGVYGKPPSISDMLASTTGTSSRVVDVFESEYDRSVNRQKRIAEELTGGKME